MVGFQPLFLRTSEAAPGHRKVDPAAPTVRQPDLSAGQESPEQCLEDTWKILEAQSLIINH